MRLSQLIKRNLVHFWRTNLAVVAGVATAVAVLAGALLVGDSVRGSLRALFLQKLGSTTHAVVSNNFFREQLAEDIAKHFPSTAPIIALPGAVTDEKNRRVAAGVSVYGVDERFWQFHGRENRAPHDREALISEGLARELTSSAGDVLLVRVQRHSDIPIESLHSKKEDLTGTLRLTTRAVLPAAELGEFSIQPSQTATRAVFVPLDLLQQEVDQRERVNLLLVNSDKEQALTELVRVVEQAATLADFGVQVRQLANSGTLSVEHDSKVLTDALAAEVNTAAQKTSLKPQPILSYLANDIRSGDRSIPYSLVTAVDDETFRQQLGSSLVSGELASPHEGSNLTPIILNEWAARDLGIKPQAKITLDYYYWHEGGRLETRQADFYLAGIARMTGLAADRELVPEYPGISGSENLADWDPPFPVDLDRIRQQDEDYWDQFRTTPKAFIPLLKGQELWSTRFGNLTSIRLAPSGAPTTPEIRSGLEQALRTSITPAEMGLSVMPVRAQGLTASRGATNFGEYFLYFSFFLVVSALLLTTLFFKLGVEQRLREVGLLQSLGFSARLIRRVFVTEGFVLSLIGSSLGLIGAIAYGRLMIFGLSTWWVEAVGTSALALHINPISLVLGLAGGVLAALFCILITLRGLRHESSRALLAGTIQGNLAGKPKRRWLSAKRVGIVCLAVGVLLLAAGALALIDQALGFFGGGTLLLVAALSFLSDWLGRNRRRAIYGNGWWPVLKLGFRNATNRPARSVLCIALIASAAFIIVSVDAFRRDRAGAIERKSGNGGYALMAESVVPLVHDPNTPDGRESLNLSDAQDLIAQARFARFRLRPGDDASCLNLYQPQDPRIVAPQDEFIDGNRFTFARSMAESAEEKANPWSLLRRQFPDGAVPVIGDANSLTYVLHLKVGDDFVIGPASNPITLRVVGALSDSIFQSELLMSEANFVKLFPGHQGFRFFLIESADEERATTLASLLEDRWSDYGFDASATTQRLAEFHRVENTYLSTFQMLGGLGLVLGTLGLAAVLLRNVLERRRELALLRAVGYNSSHFTLMVVAENALLLFLGLLTGTVCAVLAIAPVFLERGGSLAQLPLGLLLLAVLVAGLVASVLATWAALRTPLLPALRSE